jgi:hypothetical protein
LKQRQTNVFRDAGATKKYNIAVVDLTYQFAGDIGAGLGEFHDQQSRDARDSGQRRFERNEPKIHPTVARWISFANDNHIEPERLVSKQNNLPIRKILPDQSEMPSSVTMIEARNNIIKDQKSAFAIEQLS